MPRKPERKPETQTTDKGYEIPVPKRGDVLRALKKVAPPAAPSDDDAGSAEK
jgi:hypothetical protein